MKSPQADQPGFYQQNRHYQNLYSDESHYRSELSPGFTNINSLNTFPHENYNTQYVNAVYRPLSAMELNETQLNAQERVEQQNANLSNKYMELNPEYLENDHQANEPINANQYQPNTYNSYEPVQKPPPYEATEPPMFSGPRSNDYVINTPYPMPDQKVKNKSVAARCCGQLFSVFLVVFMLLLSFLLIQSFRANLTASYIARHNQNEWRSKSD